MEPRPVGQCTQSVARSSHDHFTPAADLPAFHVGNDAGTRAAGRWHRDHLPDHYLQPDKVEATDERIASLKMPRGFGIAPFATGLKNPRIIAVAEKGDIYVSRRDQGDVLLLKDDDGDGKADGKPVVVANRPGAHGLAIHEGKLYLITVREVFVADINADGRLGQPSLLISDLPDAGQHGNRTIAFGPDGMLYISVGSTCNACNESSPESAAMLRVDLKTKSRTIFASGLRNTIGFDWHPNTGALWGMDNGIDYLGDEAQPEELNKIEFGKQYGWPHIWGKDGINPQSTPVGGITKGEWKASSVPMVLGYDAHAAPMQLVFTMAAGHSRRSMRETRFSPSAVPGTVKSPRATTS